jgi:hypothetical protein
MMDNQQKKGQVKDTKQIKNLMKFTVSIDDDTKKKFT